jgi:hypothetical protein
MRLRNLPALVGRASPRSHMALDTDRGRGVESQAMQFTIQRAAPIGAALAIGILAGLLIAGRYETVPTRSLPIRIDRWTGRSELVVPAIPSPTPFDPDAYLAAGR